MRFGMAMIAVLGSLAIANAPTLTAYAAGTSGMPSGNDVSYPQCDKTLPSRQAFGILGVNEGLANTTNRSYSASVKGIKSLPCSIMRYPGLSPFRVLYDTAHLMRLRLAGSRSRPDLDVRGLTQAE